MQRAIDEFPAGYRLIFVLHDIEGFEHNEIAAMLECSIGNSKSQLHKARLKLREALRTHPRRRAGDERKLEPRSDCAAFQAQLPELIGSGENLADHPHLQSCELCRALLKDLETIAEAARQLFPIVEPPDELWEQIESKIKDEEGGEGNNESNGMAKPAPSR